MTLFGLIAILTAIGVIGSALAKSVRAIAIWALSCIVPLLGIAIYFIFFNSAADRVDSGHIIIIALAAGSIFYIAFVAIGRWIALHWFSNKVAIRALIGMATVLTPIGPGILSWAVA